MHPVHIGSFCFQSQETEYTSAQPDDPVDNPTVSVVKKVKTQTKRLFVTFLIHGYFMLNLKPRKTLRV